MMMKWFWVAVSCLLACADVIKSADLCTSEECVKAASKILNSMDKNYHACDDFYMHACGHFIVDFPATGTESFSSFQQLSEQDKELLKKSMNSPPDPADPLPVNQFKNIMIGCNDIEQRNNLGVRPFINITDELGGWPMGTLNNISDNYDWQVAVAKAHQYQVPTLFSTSFMALPEDTSKQYLNVHAPKFLGLFLLNLTSHIKHMAGRVFKEVNGATPTVEQFAEINVMAVNVSLLVIHLIENIDNTTEKTTIGELQKKTDAQQEGVVDWLNLLQAIFTDAGLELSSSTELYVNGLEYFTKLPTVLMGALNIDTNVVANLIGGIFVQTTGDQLDEDIRNMFPSQMDLWEECFLETHSSIGWAMDYIFLQELDYHSQKQKKVSDIVENILASFKQLLPSTYWMDNTTRTLAAEKVDAMVRKISFPDYIATAEALTYHYQGIIVNSEEHYLTFLQNNQWKFNKVADEKFEKPVNRKKWNFYSTTVNADYNARENSIEILAAITQAPFFDNGIQVLNYGGIGMVSAHEITHGFDNSGRKFDKDGNYKQWWSDDIIVKYNELAQCFVDQYSNITLSDGTYNISLPGEQELGENIADNGGIQEAYNAYFNIYLEDHDEEPALAGMEGYTKEQLFFYSYSQLWCGNQGKLATAKSVFTDVHSQAHFRVNVPLQNFEAFSQAFSCPVGSGMNPINKCFLW